MPAAAADKVTPKIIDPASEHGDEIDASVDRDRIRVVCWTSVALAYFRYQLTLCSWQARPRALLLSSLMAKTTR